LSGHIQPSKRVYFTLQRSGIKLVRPLSVDNTRGHSSLFSAPSTNPGHSFVRATAEISRGS